MHLSDYQAQAMRTRGEYRSKEDQLIAACLGLSGENGEFIDLVKKRIYHQKSIEPSLLEKELGDVLWYAALAADALGLDLDVVAGKNIDKLRLRYPGGFGFGVANCPQRDIPEHIKKNCVKCNPWLK